MRHFVRFAATVAVLFGVMAASGGAVGGFQVHGIGFAKGCQSPTTIGDPYLCLYIITNNVDTAHDSLTISSIVDNVHAFGGDVSQGNILSSLTLHLSGGAFCNNTPVNGTGSGNTSCTIPFGGSIVSDLYSQYSPTGADWANLPGHVLTDTADLTWQDTCVPSDNTPPSSNCVANTDFLAPAGSQSEILQLPSSTATSIHNAAHQVVTAVAAGSTVHDFVTVTGVQGKPVPSGNVNVDWFLNNTCAGQPQSSSGSVGPLDGNGQFDAIGFAKGPLAAGLFAFRANYLGDDNYVPSDGGCEPLTVVDADIQISPLTATNPIGTNHTLTGHVNVNDGTGSAPAPANTQISFSIESGPGSFVGGVNTCLTIGATGSCTVQITSAVPGVTTVKASTDVSVVGVSLHRETGDGLPGDSGNASKQWVGAKIAIAPSATNAVGAPHTFTVTVSRNTGSGYVAAPGEHVDFTLTNSNGAAFVLNAAASTCDNAGPNTDAQGQCVIVFTSPTGGQVTGHASAVLAVDGGFVTVQTDATGDNSADAVKTYVDANIQITPQIATNPIGTTHTLTGHVNVNNGAGGFTNAPAGTLITFTKVSGPGSFVGGINTCTTVGATGSCTVQITSLTTGTTVVKAATDVTVGGVVLHRETADGLAGDSGNASKNWVGVGAQISIAPSATNEVGQPHTFTVTLLKDTGTGIFVPAAGEHVDFTLTDSNGGAATLNAAASTCDNAGPNTNAQGQCTIVFSSPTSGKVTGHASATLTLGGGPVHVETTGTGGNGSDAVKTFVDAYITISPPEATNPTGTIHTYVAQVFVNTGNGLFVPAPDGTVVTFTLLPGSVGSFTAGNTCVTSGGSCSINTTSSVGGNDTMQASTTVTVGGVTMTRRSLERRERDDDFGCCSAALAPAPAPAPAPAAAPAARDRHASRDRDREGSRPADGRAGRNGDLQHHGHEHRRRDAHERPCDGCAGSGLREDVGRHSGAGVDGTGCLGHLHVHACERAGGLHERRGRDGHPAGRPGRHGER